MVNEVDIVIHSQSFAMMADGHVPEEQKLIDFMVDFSPRVKWAIEHSETGVRIVRIRLMDKQVIQYQLNATLTHSDATYWELKYNGT